LTAQLALAIRAAMVVRCPLASSTLRRILWNLNLITLTKELMELVKLMKRKAKSR
jgi:hypothetical protein